jgi:hypothetical protein
LFDLGKPDFCSFWKVEIEYAYMVELVAAARRKGALLPEGKRVDTWATKADRPLRREMPESSISIGCDSACMRPPMATEWRISLYCSFQCKIVSIGFFFGGSGEW